MIYNKMPGLAHFFNVEPELRASAASAAPANRAIIRLFSRAVSGAGFPTGEEVN
jgi:hypothetical protein